MRKILITRPNHQAYKTERKLQGLGYDTFTEPLLFLRKSDHQTPDYSQYDYLIFTSRNSFDFWDFESVDKNTPILAVGPQTAEKAEACGFKNVTNIDGTAKDVAAYLGTRTALHIGGYHISHNFGESVDRLIVYEAAAAKDLSEDCKQAFIASDIDLVMLYSTRTAKLFVRFIQANKLERTLESARVLSISENVLRSVRALPWKVLHKADKPNGTSMIDTCKRIMSDEYE